MTDGKIVVKFKARINEVKFYNEDNNYHIMTFSTKQNIPKLRNLYGEYVGTLVGNCVKCIPGDVCNVEAEGVVHPTFGFQYKIVSLGFDRPHDSGSLYTFLSAILTEAQATVLYNRCPDIVDRVLEDNNYVPDLSGLKGIGEKTWYRIRDKIIDNLGYAELINLLSPVGCTLYMIKQIAKKRKDLSLLRKEILDNPYILCEIPRMGFKKVDNFAIQINPNLKYSEQRVYKCINYILEDIANNDGHCYIPINELKNKVQELIADKEILSTFDNIIEAERQKCVENKNPILFVDFDTVGQPMYKRMEQFIMNKLIDIQNTDNLWDLSYNEFFNSMKNTTKQQGFYLSEEQTEVVRSIAEKNITVISGKAGCVDCDTEYFNGTEWVRIADYKEGDKVLQYNCETQEASLAYPELYHKYPCNTLWHFETKYGLDQCLCDNHNVVYMTSKGNIQKKVFSEFKKQHESSKRGFQGRFLTSFKYSGDGIDLTDEEIRIMVAVIADGTFNYHASENWDSYYRCRFHIKKNRKKERLRKLFKKAQCVWTEKESSSVGYTDFYINAPRREKVFTKDYWYNCNQHQLQIIFDEIWYWDGAFDSVKGLNKKQFFTNIKETADFIQFVCSSCGYRSMIYEYNRVGKTHVSNKKIYEYKTIEYTVLATSKNKIGMTRRTDLDKEKVSINSYKTKDGYKYCFTMPLGTLILRRNNKIFITGNCGKTSVIKAILEVYKNHSIGMAALSAKAAKRMREVTGFEDAKTIHRLLGYNGTGFLYNESSTLPYDLLILDECSMNNIYLFYSILKATTNKTKIVMAGDLCQLAAIGVGSVFSDLVQNPIFNNHLLTQVYRQSEDSYINEHANIIREGIMPFDIKKGNMPFGTDIVYIFRNTSEDILNMTVNLYLKFLETVNIEDIAIVVPRKNTVCISCETINNLIQERLLSEEDRYIKHGDKIIKVGARIINKKNDYEKGVLNGELGEVISVDSTYVTIRFDEGQIVNFQKGELDNIELGYAISVHSSQGSQYKVTIVAMDMSSFTLLTSNMIYTAMTRACETLIVVSQPTSFQKAVTNVQEHHRNTYLKLLLPCVDKQNINDNIKENAKKHRCRYEREDNQLYINEKEKDIDYFINKEDELPF